MQIAFPSDDSNLFAEQLSLLSKKKQPNGAWVVADASASGGQLVVELQDPGITAPVRAFGTTETMNPALQKSVTRSIWNQRAKGKGATPVHTGTSIRILSIHGIGHGDVDPNLVPNWTASVTAQLRAANPTLQPMFEFLQYDDLFDQAPHNVLTYAEAFMRLGWSGVTSFFGDLFGRRGGMTDSIRWTAGMVAQWAENPELRAETRRRIADAVERFQPDLVLAHSLGTLISYDTFSRVKQDSGKPWDGPGLIAGRFYVSMGSQIGSRFTRKTLGGRINPLNARHWFHLYNRHDDAFTAEIRLSAPNFDQLLTPFDIDGVLDHEATEYIKHRVAFDGCWRSIALAEPQPDAPKRKGRSTKPLTNEESKESGQRLSVLRPILREAPRRRALLVGINDYPNPAERLEGCVNDVFLMSSLLQENGFDAEDIRVVLNDRATAKGILERLEWLLEGADDGMERVFYYSGHGAQIPGYGIGEKVDRKDECLVAHDFDWSRERAVTDDQFYDLYSQLPYETKFCAIFDCCHSGGIAREGGLKVRGLTPPDDIRHRALRWDKDEGMWLPRDLRKASKQRNHLINNRRKHTELFGEEGDEHRLFRAAALRAEDKDFNLARKAFGHYGPFLPVILQACKEKQYSYEYRHGVTSYGAFTDSLAQYLREQGRAKNITWQKMVTDVGVKLKRLRYDQEPCLVCPSVLRTAAVPWGLKDVK